MEEIDIREIFEFIISKIYIIIICILVCLIAGNIYLAKFQTPLYRSTTTIVLVSDTSDVTQSEVALNSSLVSTYSNIITSRKILSQVIYNLGLNMSVGELSSNINVSSVTGTSIIEIVVANKDNELAKSIATEVTNVFIQEIPNYYKMENVAILDEASIENRPFNINVTKQNAVYFAIGVIVGVVILFMQFSMDTSIKDAKTVEDKLGLSVLGTVPKAGGKHGKHR